MDSNLIFTNSVGRAIDSLCLRFAPKGVYVLCDANTARCVAPLLSQQSQAVADAPMIVIEAGDEHKTVDALCGVWQQLGALGATRSSLLLNVGGGMVTDLGGFAAATYKRGMRCVNVATTLLGAVDAAVGGKTAVNFGGLKNEVGVFSDPSAVVISTLFFATLPPEQMLSGYAEMLKHGLLSSRQATARLLSCDILEADADALLPLVEESVKVKCAIVEADPREQGLRKALNLGHTAGHAFEAMALARGQAMPHGYAVARGLVVALVLSHMLEGFPSDLLHSTAAFVRENYGGFPLSCDDYPRLLQLMSRDKKNPSPEAISFTLLSDAGAPRIGRILSPDDIRTALDIYRDLIS